MNSLRFFVFSFTPKKLVEQRVLVQTEFSDTEKNVMRKRSKINLPKLLEKIRTVSNRSFPDLIASLSRMDVLLLIYEYPFHEESNETRRRINEILSSKYTSLVGRTAWHLFQQDIKDAYLQDLVKKSINRERGFFLHIDEKFLRPLERSAEGNRNIIKELTNFLIHATYKTSQILSHWKVKEGSVLEDKLVFEMLSSSLHNDSILKRDGISCVAKILDKFPMNEYKSLIKIYIESRDHKSFHYELLNQAIQRLHNPTDRIDDWTFLTNQALEQINRWLMFNKLKKFFDSDTNSKRFDYWKRYIDYMESVMPLKNPFAAFIYFKNFVVVEFGEMGAAYFYHKEGFEEVIYPRINDYRFKNRGKSARESMLKETDSVFSGYELFIVKMEHRGSWPYRFDVKMRDLLIEFNG
ncbi:hypothetical protein P4361_05915 [Fictibacillus sp. B-59209]|uniref:hypothetical protein n=1 Tax=Fictibacillus sp. B-59209 TaxID=3024873 RepID=UPI002E2306E5|nr:hypothetical protein [Fictibacillus sp. B-59209]